MVLNKKIYVYPNYEVGAQKKNPYIFHLVSSLSERYSVTNHTSAVKKGVSDIVSHFDADTFIINWPENLASRRFGFVQVVIFISLLLRIKAAKKKIIWIMHNKEAHHSKSWLSNLCMSVAAKMSTYTITHSLDGIEHYKTTYKKDNIVYYPHPVYPDLHFPVNEVVYDFIIWGSIDAYKNILVFLEFLQKNVEAAKYKFLICGSCKDKGYLDKILNAIDEMPNVTFINEFLSDSRLAAFISQSKAIIYTYNQSSVLSSGALIYSLSSKKMIIGPYFGNFKELADNGLIATYQTFTDIFEAYKSFVPSISHIDEYINTYTWANFSEFIFNTELKYS